MDLHRLRTFQALSETLHFRHAAERLGITQSAVSQQIATLEKDLGAMLFERIGRRVYLTPAGEVLAREAVKVLSTVSLAREAVGAVSKGDAGRLRVGPARPRASISSRRCWGRFRADFPLVELDFRIANSSRIEALAVANEFDLGVCGFRPTHEELFEVELGEDRIIAVAAPALIGKTRRVRPGDLGRWPLVARRARQRHPDGGRARAASLGVALVPRSSFRPEAIVRAAEAGLGYAFVSARAVTDGIETGRLVEVRVQELDVRRGLFAVYHRDKQVTPPMRELMDLLRARLGQSDKSA